MPVSADVINMKQFAFVFNSYLVMRISIRIATDQKQCENVYSCLALFVQAISLSPLTILSCNTVRSELDCLKFIVKCYFKCVFIIAL